MESFKSMWLKISAVLGVIISALLYYINLRNKQAATLQAKVDLVNTTKQADLLEADIRKKIDQKDMLAKEIEDHNKALAQIEVQRNKIKQEQETKNAKEIVDYWNK